METSQKILQDIIRKLNQNIFNKYYDVRVNVDVKTVEKIAELTNENLIERIKWIIDSKLMSKVYKAIPYNKTINSKKVVHVINKDRIKDCRIQDDIQKTSSLAIKKLNLIQYKNKDSVIKIYFYVTEVDKELYLVDLDQEKLIDFKIVAIEENDKVFIFNKTIAEKELINNTEDKELEELYEAHKEEIEEIIANPEILKESIMHSTNKIIAGFKDVLRHIRIMIKYKEKIIEVAEENGLVVINNKILFDDETIPELFSILLDKEVITVITNKQKKAKNFKEEY